MWVRVNGRDLWRNGIETELYRGDYTFSFSGGLQNGIGRSTGYGNVEAGYYSTDDLFFSIGFGGHSSYRSAFTGAEWRPFTDNAVSAFSNFGAGNIGGGFAIVGMRYSLGAGPISLKKQHREYDPPNILTHFSSGAGGGAAITQAINKPIATVATVVAAPVCFVAGTLVLMADGTGKNIEDVTVGDILQGMDGTDNEVLILKPAILADRKLYALNGGKGFVTSSHPFMTSEGWKSIDPDLTNEWLPDLKSGKLMAGDELVTLGGLLELIPTGIKKDSIKGFPKGQKSESMG